MPVLKFREHPRGGVDNETPRFTEELQLPCIVLVDTSGSMKPKKDELIKGLELLGDTIKEDDLAAGRVQLSIIGFDDQPRILEPFRSMDNYEVPEIDCGGMTAMHQAVDLALSEIETVKSQYKEEGIDYYRPWLFMLTDGQPNDEDNGAFERLLDAQKGSHIIFFPVGIGYDYDLNTLRNMQVDGTVLEADADKLARSFEWLGNSLTVTSQSNPGDSVPLPNPEKSQLRIKS